VNGARPREIRGMLNGVDAGGLSLAGNAGLKSTEACLSLVNIVCCQVGVSASR